MKLNLIKTPHKKSSVAFLIDNKKKLSDINLTKNENDFVLSQIQSGNKIIMINKFPEYYWICYMPVNKNVDISEKKEFYRVAANNLYNEIKKTNITSIDFQCHIKNKELLYCFFEGFALSDYQFSKYKSNADKSCLKNANILSERLSKDKIKEIETISKAIKYVKDLVNEPNNVLNANKLANEIVNCGIEFGFRTEVFDLEKITELGMGGILAVNKGSIEPATFSVLEWSPENAKNTKPIVLIGKGVVYDTGGINLKPSKSLEHMNSDMAGAAAVLGIFIIISQLNLPIHVIGLIPATDNRPGLNSYVPNDIIKMYDGSTVEITNTDAEGRLLLADAIAYSNNLSPELIISIATLTGSARATIGPYGIICLSNCDSQITDKLIDTGNDVYERVVTLPLWDEYKDFLKSDVADIKNSGGSLAGAITAGKFLEHFAKHPMIHLDIASMAYLDKAINYKGKGASGVPVRLLYNFLRHLY
ncbi:MAG: hypothetical protein Kow0068_14110 [Marinilabiliales bacterium]